MKKPIIAIAVGGMMLAGCMSMEERLASSDVSVRNAAEHELVRNAYSSGVPKSERLAAIKRVKNQTFLEYLATSATDSSKEDGIAAVGNIEDVPVLIRVSQTATSMDVRKAASAKINDESVLCEIACGKYGYKGKAGDALCLDAQARLKDTAMIAKVAEKSKSTAASKAAFERLGAEERQRIAVSSGRSDFLGEEIKAGRLNDKVMEAVFSKGDTTTKKAFIEACSDEALLLQVVERYGAKLSGDDCAALSLKKSMPKLKTNIGTIADKKIVEELKQFINANVDGNHHLKANVPTEKNKSLADKFSAISDSNLRVAFLKEIINTLYSNYEWHPVAKSWFGSLTAEEVVALFPSVYEQKQYAFAACLPDAMFINLIGRKDLNDELAEMFAIAIKRGERKVDVDAALRQNVNFNRLYPMIKNAETAEYVWENATLKGFDASRHRMSSVWKKLSPLAKKKYRDLALSNAANVKKQKPVFGGLYVGMPLRDCLALLLDVEDYKFRVNKYGPGASYQEPIFTYDRKIEDWRKDGLVRKIKLHRKERYKIFPQEDKGFWAAFVKEFMPQSGAKKGSTVEALGEALDAAFGNYERAHNDELDEICYVLKSMKYGVRAWYGLDSGTLILEAFEE